MNSKKPVVYVNGRKLGEAAEDVNPSVSVPKQSVPDPVRGNAHSPTISRVPGDYTKFNPNADRLSSDRGRLQEPGWQYHIDQTDATRLKRRKE